MADMPSSLPISDPGRDGHHLLCIWEDLPMFGDKFQA
jgi:hypothetical protein